ncbi:methyltransferase domain-containing protein (plasmid) [Azospirillum sp. TSA2s]|uniref:class I SAM-dependent methyltransferase n=1 Tax=Azospirillum sp. TSA2s TaxID=709810 RepID=UPI0010AA2D50|nr:methyltransferase domain-containing protein [Azospirillum sp. TSA2s]QCG93010.1 methyltransferase domain-containing protein [Azospirillum sp. TSA2s]
MDRIDNKANYRSPSLVTGYDAHRRIGEDDYVNSLEVGYFIAQVRRLAGPSGSIIDMGAGTGKLSLAFARLGYAVTAFDQSDAMLERLEAKARAEGLTIAVRQGDIVADVDDAPSAPSHDVAVSSRVLMHVADPDVMIRHMAKRSRRGIVLDAPRRASPNRLLAGWRSLTGGEVYRCFDDRSLLDSVGRCGLRVIDASPLFTLPIGLHLALHRKAVSTALERALRPARGAASTLFLAAERTG